MSKWANTQRARECAEQLVIATDALRRATMFLGLLQQQFDAMPDDPDLPDGTEPQPPNTYTTGY